MFSAYFIILFTLVLSKEAKYCAFMKGVIKNAISILDSQ